MPEARFVRIKKGVRPYGGRRARIHRFHTYPNGREVVEVFAPRDVRAGWMHVDIREYNIGDVEILKDERRGA